MYPAQKFVKEHPVIGTIGVTLVIDLMFASGSVVLASLSTYALAESILFLKPLADILAPLLAPIFVLLAAHLSDEFSAILIAITTALTIPVAIRTV